MKKALIIFLLPIYFHATAQQQNDDEEVKRSGFQKDRLFTGGSANIGFSNGTTMLGITPQLGYSLTNWLDAGINVNINYISQRDYYTTDKLRQMTYGPGAFLRIFPINFLFAGVQYEYNMMQLKYISNTSPTQKASVNASSFLIGGGYAGGREKGRNTYYFLSIMWDVAGDKNSPYVDNLGRSTPVIRAGYNIGLFQNRYRNRY